MASNIRVVLEIDNKKYLADLKTAERATDTFSRNTVNSAGRVDKALDGIGRGFGRLKTAIAGIALTALGRSLLQLADELDDVSNSTGIAIGRLIEFQNAIQGAGGSPADMSTALLKFSQALDTAAEGSIKAQNQLIGLGISLDELRNKSDEQLLIRTLEELSKMEAGARRTALMVEYFGKSFKTVDPRQLLDQLRATRGEGDQYANSVKQAAEVNAKLEKAFTNLRLALLQGFGPAISQFAEFTENVIKNKQAMEDLMTTVKTLAVVIGGAFAVSGLLILVRLIGTAGRGVGAAITLFQKFGAAIGLSGTAAGALGASISGAFRAAGPLLTALRGLVVILGTLVTGVIAANQIFDNFGDIATNAIARVIEKLGELTAELLNLPTDGLAALLNMFLPENLKIKDAVGLGTPFKIAAENARKAREEFERTRQAARRASTAGAGRGNYGMTPVQPGEGVAVATGQGVLGTMTTAQQDAAATGGGRPVDETDRLNAIKQIRQIGEELTKNLAKRREALNLETKAIGISEDVAEALKLEADVRDEIGRTIESLIQKRETLGKEEQYLKPIINEQIALLQKREATEVESALKSLNTKQLRAAQDRIEIQNAKQINDLENLRAQLLGYTLTELEKFNQAQRAGDFRSKTREEIELLKQQAIARDAETATLTAQKTTRETNNKLLELESSLLGTQFTELQKLEQLKAANPEAFARKTQEETSALQAQATALDEAATKFRALAFARDLQRQGEDFAAGVRDQLNLDRAVGESARRRINVEIEGRNQLQSKLREIADRYGNEKNLSEELRQARQKEIDDATAGITKLIELKKKSVEEDQAIRDSFEFGWENAFSKYAEDANNAANQARTYFETFTKGFEDAFVKFVQTGKFSFKDLINSIIADFARLQAKKFVTSIFGGGGGGGGFFGDIFGSIGKIFGFANGGNPAMNKPILVGERGPELMIPRNASTIIPNEALGGGGNQTMVTYNIQAVDAASFQQLVAQDPKFLHAVVEKGRRSMPQGARR